MRAAVLLALDPVGSSWVLQRNTDHGAKRVFVGRKPLVINLLQKLS